MGIVLYDNPASSNAMKVRFLLAELGLDYERRHVPLAHPRPGWYKARYQSGRGWARGTCRRSYGSPSSASRNRTFMAFDEAGLS